MYNVTQDYLDLIMAQKTNIEWNWHVMITTTGGMGYALSMQDLKQGQSRITRDIVTGNSLEIGSTCSAEISLGIFLTEINGQYYLDEQVVDRYAFFGAEIEIEFQLYIPGEGMEGVPCGKYTVTDATRTANVLTLTGYDNMLKFSEALSDPEDKTCYEWLAEACEACDVELGNTQEEIEDMPNGTFITGGYEISTRVKSWRDMVGHVAAMLCGYAIIGRDGKLYIRQYSMSSVRTISKSWRYKSEVADYETYYSSLTFTNERRNEQMKVERPGDGLEYAMAQNPLLQYPNYYATERRLRDILNRLAVIQYTPFDIQTPLDPALDVGDVIELTEGQTVSGKLAAITSITMPLNGKMTLKGVGQNPRTAEKSTLEKKLDEMNNTAYAGEARYDHYINDAEIAIEDNTQQRVIVLTYESATNSHVDFHGEVCYDIEIDEVIDPQTGDITKEAELSVTYYQDGVAVQTYHPTEKVTVDGKHILNLMYFWIQRGNKKNGSFVAWLNVTGGAITIPQGYSRGYICSQGWDTQNGEDWDDPRELIYIEVTTMPTKTEYEIGETLDYTGVVVTAYYSDNTMEDVTYSCTYTPAHGEPATSGLEDVQVEYKKDGGTYETSFPVIIEGEWDDVYEVNGGRMMIATASASMAKGDTVYFENQVGEWTDVTSTVGMDSPNNTENRIISEDNRYVYMKYSNSYIYKYDTSTTPWTKSLWADKNQIKEMIGILSSVYSFYIGQSGNIGCIAASHGSGVSDTIAFYFFDLSTSEHLFTVGPINGNWNIAQSVVYGFRVFEDYICFKYPSGGERYSVKINVKTSEIFKTYADGNFGNRIIDWESPTEYYVLDHSHILRKYQNAAGDNILLQNMTINSLSGLSSTGDTACIYYNGKVYVGYRDNMTCIDVSTNTWTEIPLTFPTAFIPDITCYGVGTDSSKVVIPTSSGNLVLGLLDLDTGTWNVVGYYQKSTSYYPPAMLSDKYMIHYSTVFYNTGAGTIAYKAYNNLHGSRSLGYALKDMAAGEKAKYRVLFD